MKVATFNINNIKNRLANLLAWPQRVATIRRGVTCTRFGPTNQVVVEKAAPGAYDMGFVL